MTTEPTTRTNPYPGPRSFETGEELFGRTRESRQLLNLLIAERIVLLYSPSGAGKTSLVQAALIPDLVAEGFRVLPPMRVSLEAEEAVSGVRNRYLLSLLLSLEARLEETERTPVAQLAAMTLADYLTQPQTQHLGFLPAHADGWDGDVLIFDQFEEILTIDPTDRVGKQAFFAEVGAVLQARNRWALFAMREEFLAGLDPYLLPIPTRFATNFRLELLGPTAAIQAMQRPAQAQGVDFTPAAAQQLADDLRTVREMQPDGALVSRLGDAIEPVQLQVVCRRLWDGLAADDRVIDQDDLASVGDVNSALRAYYDDSVAAIAAETGIAQRTIRIWVNSLITESGFRTQLLQGPTQGLDTAAIWPLVDAHLVRADRRRGATWFELAHDRLVTPVQEANAAWFAANLSTLQRQAALWDQQDRPEGLLLRGDELVAAEQWAKTQPTLEGFESDFLKLSRDEHKRTERETQQNQRIRWLAVGATVVAALAIVAAIWASVERGRAEAAKATSEAESRRSHANQLAADVTALIAAGNLDPSLTLMLARDAVLATSEDGYATSVAEEALRQAILNAPSWQMTLPQARHDGAILDLAFASDGSLVTAGADQMARIWNTETGALNHVLVGHTDAVWSVAYALDNETIITGSSDGTMRVWDAKHGIERTQVKTDSPIWTVAVTSNSSLAVTGHEDGSLLLWYLNSGTLARRLGKHAARVSTVQWNPDGSQLLSVGDDQQLILWDMKRRQIAFSIQTKLGILAKAAFDPSGSQIAIPLIDGTVQIYSSHDGQLLHTLPIGTHRLFDIAYISSDHFLVTQKLGPVQRVTISTSETKTLFGSDTDVFESIAVNSDATVAATTSPQGELRLWRLTDGEEITPFAGHSDLPAILRFAPNGESLISVGMGADEALLWDTRAGQQIARLVGHNDSITDVAFSPNGAQVVTAGADGIARLWDSRSGDLLPPYFGQAAYVNAVDFSPDGSWLVTASDDGTACLWQVATGFMMHCLRHEDWVMDAAFSPDGNLLATTSADGRICLWMMASTKPVVCWEEHIGIVDDLTFSPDGSKLLSIDETGYSCLWHIPSSTLEACVESGEGLLYKGSFLADGRVFAVAGQRIEGGSILSLWSTTTQQRLNNLPSDLFNPIAFSPVDKLAVAASIEGAAVVWNVETGVEIQRLRGHNFRRGERITAVAFSADGKRIATGSEDHTIRIWNVQPVAKQWQLSNAMTSVKAIAYDSAHSRLAVAGDGNTIELWRPETGELTHRLEIDVLSIAALDFSPDGRYLVAVASEGGGYLWNLEEVADPIVFAVGEAGAYTVRFKNGELFATGDAEGQVQFWNGTNATLLDTMELSDSPLLSIDFSPDGTQIAVGDGAGITYILEVETGELLFALRDHAANVYAVTFTPDGQRLVTAGENVFPPYIHIWDVKKGVLLHSLTEPQSPVHAVLFAPDGLTLITGGGGGFNRDNSVRVWDAETWKELRRYELPLGSVTALAVTKDKNTIYFGAGDTVYLWPDIEQLQATAADLIQRDPVSYKPAERRRYGVDRDNIIP